MSALQYEIQISGTKGSCQSLSRKLIFAQLVKPIAYPTSSIHSSENVLQNDSTRTNKILTVGLHLVDFLEARYVLSSIATTTILFCFNS